MLKVGLTGGIGSGKSTVARRLASHGAVVVDADLLAREVVAANSEGLTEVATTFGEGVLSQDGTLDRAALGRLVFGDAEARRRLEAITHPRIRALTEARFRAAGSDAVVVHDVPLLVELGYEDRYHLTVVVHADVEERVRRLVVERGSTEAEARSRIAAQADDLARRAAADVWLDNTAAVDDLLETVDALWRGRLVPFEANVRQRRRAETGRLVELSPPDPGWSATGRRLAARVRRVAGERAVSVEHVGSTAVPGLVAKDVVDLQLVVSDLAVADALAQELAEAGFPPVAGTWSDTPKPGALAVDAEGDLGGDAEGEVGGNVGRDVDGDVGRDASGSAGVGAWARGGDAGAAPDDAGVVLDGAGVAPDAADAVPDAAGVAPDAAGVAPDAADAVPDAADAAPDAAGVWAKRLHGNADPARPVHLHVRTAGSPGARYALMFRDWLRADEAARREYEIEKRRLALLHPLRSDYADAKEPWFTDVAWPRMQLWAADTGWASTV